MVDGGDVLGRHTDLDDLQVPGRLEHPVANLRRLNHAVSGGQDERRSLVLVDEADPPVDAEDQLKADRVVVDHVRYGSGVRYADVRGDDAATQASGNQIPVLHAGPADHPRRVVFQPSHDEGMRRRRHLQRRIGIDEKDAATVGCRELARPAGEGVRILAGEPQRGRRDGRAPLDADMQPVSRQRRHRGVIGGEDRVEAEAKGLGVIGEISREVGRRQAHSGRVWVRRHQTVILVASQGVAAAGWIS